MPSIHVTRLSTSNPQAVGTAAPGSTGQASDAGHVHAHGDQAGGSLHALASAIAHGFLSAADFSKLAGFGAAGEYLRRDGTTPLTGNWALGGFNLSGVGTVGCGAITTTALLTGTSVRMASAGGVGVFGPTALGGSLIPNVGGAMDVFVQVGSATAQQSAASTVFVNDGVRNTRVGLFVADEPAGAGAWGHWLTHSTGGVQPYVIGMAATEMLRISTSGDAAIRGDLVLGVDPATAAAPAGTRLYVVGENGRVLAASTSADATQKLARFGVQHFTNAEEPFDAVRADSNGTANTLALGGGSALGNAATQVSIYTASTFTTTSGTERFRIDSSGLVQTLNGSGLTVAGALNGTSAGFTGNVTLNSAAPTLTIGNGTGFTGGSAIVINKADTHIVSMAWQVAGSARWIEQFDGSENLNWLRRDASGGPVDTPLSLNWTDGTATFANQVRAPSYRVSTGATLPSIEVTANTNQPEGNVTAPILSEHFDTAETSAENIGRRRWVKVTGTGNTGWMISEAFYRRVTTTASGARIFAIDLPDPAFFHIEGTVVAMGPSGDRMTFSVYGGVHRAGGNAALLYDFGAVIHQTSALGWTCAVINSTSAPNGIIVVVTGAASTTITWTANLRITESR